MLYEIYHAMLSCAMLRCAVPCPALVWCALPWCLCCAPMAQHPCHAVLCYTVSAVYIVIQDMLLLALSHLTCTGRFFVSRILGCKQAETSSCAESMASHMPFLKRYTKFVLWTCINECSTTAPTDFCALTQLTKHNWQQSCCHTSLLWSA